MTANEQRRAARRVAAIPFGQVRQVLNLLHDRRQEPDRRQQPFDYARMYLGSLGGQA